MPLILGTSAEARIHGVEDRGDPEEGVAHLVSDAGDKGSHDCHRLGAGEGGLESRLFLLGADPVSDLLAQTRNGVPQLLLACFQLSLGDGRRLQLGDRPVELAGQDRPASFPVGSTR